MCHASLTAPFWAQYALSEIRASEPSFATYTHVGVLKMPLPTKTPSAPSHVTALLTSRMFLAPAGRGNMFINCSKL